MKKIILLLLIFCVVTSCNSKYDNILCVCYIFDPDDCYANTYIEIHQDGFIEATEGLCTDTIDHIIYDNGELYPNKNLFISSKEYPDSEYDEGCKMWIYHSYRKPIVNSRVLSQKQINKLNHYINTFLDSREDSKEGYRKIKRDYIDWNSYGIVLIVQGKVFDYWENKCSQEESTFLNLLKEISPLPVKPKKIQKSCIVSDDNDSQRIEIKVETNNSGDVGE